MKLDVLLINPGSTSAVYQNLAAEFSAIEPPSMAALFATYLRNKGLSVAIIDQPALGFTAEEVADVAVNAFSPHLIAFVVYGFQPSASTQNMDAAVACARAIKGRTRSAKILFSGTHPSALPEQTLKESSIDFVASSEGPQEIAALTQSLKLGAKEFRHIPGLYRKTLGVTMFNRPGDLMPEADMNSLMGYASWDLLPMDKYRAHNWHAAFEGFSRTPYASLHTTLGCPFKCSFCCINSPFGGSSYRMWAPKNVGEELSLLTDSYGVRNIKFVDEMFVLNKRHVIGICDQIHGRKLGDQLNIWAYARIDTVTDEMLGPMRESGFRWLALGIESASKHVRDGVEKGRFGQEDILKVVRKVQAAGINVIGNFIFGLPDDTHETMEDTLALALEANCEFANFYSAMAYPGSKLYTQAKVQGLKLPDSWIGYSQHSYETEPLPTETLTGAQVLEFRDAAFRTYFTSQSYIDMVRRKFGQPVVDHIGRMVAQPLKRKLLEGATA